MIFLVVLLVLSLAVAAWLIYANGASSSGTWSLATAFSNGNTAGT